MNHDDELRDALRSEADESRPVPGGWDRLQERLGGHKGQRARWLLPAVAAAVVLLAAVGAWQLTRDDDVTVGVTDDPATTVVVTTAPATTAPPTTASPTTAGSTAPSTAAPTTTAVPAGPPTRIVAVTVDGRLVVLDASTGVEQRELANLGDPRGGGAEGPGPNYVTQLSVTPDGATVYHDSCCEPGSGLIFVVPTDGSRPPEAITNGLGPAVSPDGRYLAYTAVNAVVVRDLTTGDERTFTDPAYDEAPLSGDVTWSLDGTKLYLPWQHDEDGGFISSVIEVDVAAGTPPRIVGESPQALEDPLALDDGLRIALLAHSIGTDGRPGPQDGVVIFTPGGLPPGQTTVADHPASSMTEVADWGYDGRDASLLVVMEDGRLVFGDSTLGTGYAVADW